MKRKQVKISRADFLKGAIAGAAGLLLSRKVNAEELVNKFNNKAPAKSVIQIWMWGGPSHLDTFDPKPEAGRDVCGPLNKPIDTNVPGIKICQLLPLLAK